MCARAIQPSHRFHFNQLFYVSELFQTLIRIILCDCVQGPSPYSHPTDFFLITHRSKLFQTSNKYNYVWLCLQGPYSHLTDFILITYIIELYKTFDKYNSVWLCVQGPYSHPTDFTLITYRSELFQTFGKYNFFVTVCARAIEPSHGFHFSQLLYISELFKYRTIDYVW